MLSPNEIEKLGKLKINLVRFEHEFGQLCGLGYSEAQAKKLIMLKSSTKTVAAVFAKTKIL